MTTKDSFFGWDLASEGAQIEVIELLTTLGQFKTRRRTEVQKKYSGIMQFEQRNWYVF